MRVLLQRVHDASVEVEGECVGAIEGAGLLLFLGVEAGDGPEEVVKLARKSVELRIFPDERHSMNRSLADAGGRVLLVSQFTLCADCRKGRRPSFAPAADPELAERLYRQFAEELARLGHPPEEGRFGADMKVRLLNDGPVTILLES